jgi:DNA-binding FadR family transcriptional regulator
VFKAIEEGILSGRYSPGEKLPSETALLQEFETSRITIVRALRELQRVTTTVTSVWPCASAGSAGIIVALAEELF